MTSTLGKKLQRTCRTTVGQVLEVCKIGQVLHLVCPLGKNDHLTAADTKVVCLPLSVETPMLGNTTTGPMVLRTKNGVLAW